MKSRLFYALLAALGLMLPCASDAQTFTSGFLNQSRSEAPGTLLSGPRDNDSIHTGRTTTVQYLNGWVIVGAEAPGSTQVDGVPSDKLMRVYDISNPANPIRKFPSDFGLPTGTGDAYEGNKWHEGNFGWNAHGSAHIEHQLAPTTVTVDTFGGVVTKGNTYNTYGLGTGGRAAMAGSWGATLSWYEKDNPSFEPFTIRKRIGSPGNWTDKLLATFDHKAEFGGGDWHPMYFGDLLIYAKSGSSGKDSIVVYRLQFENFDDPATMAVNPQLVGVLDAGFLAYWPNLYSDGDGLYVVGSGTNIVSVADITETADPDGSGGIVKVAEYVKNGLRNATYPTYQDHYGFIDFVKVDMRKLIAGDANPEALVLDASGEGIDTSQMSLPLGNIWLTGGTTSSGKEQGMAVWVHQQAADTNPPRVSYHIPQAGRTNYPRHARLSFLIHESKIIGPRNGIDFTVRKVLAGDTLDDYVPGYLIHDMSGVLTFNPDVPLDANATYQVDFLSNPNQQIGFRDGAGNYIEPYTFRFSTGNNVSGQAPPVIDSIVSNNYQPRPGQSFTVTVSATGSTSLKYRYNFDGTWTNWVNSNTRSYNYPEAGRQRILVQVRDQNQFVSSSSLSMLVMNAPTGPFATKSDTMAVGLSGSTKRLMVVNPDADTVTALRADNGNKINEYSVGDDPRGIARDANGRFWVTCHGSDEIYILNANGSVNEIVGTGYGTAPFGIAPSPDGQQMFVSFYGSGQVARFDIGSPFTPSVVSTLPTPRAIAVSGDGSRVFVTRFISTEYKGEVVEFLSNGATFEQTRIIELAYSAERDGGDRGAGVPNYLSGIAISPDGNHAIVTAKQDNLVRGLVYGRPDLTQENTVRAIAAVIDLATSTELPDARRDFDNSDSPSSVTFTPLGDLALVTLQGNNRVVAFDTLDLGAPSNIAAQIILDAPTGLAPQGFLFDPEGNRAYAQNFMDRSVHLYDAAPLLENNRSNLPLIAEKSTVANEPLADEVLLGKQIFYNASDPRMTAEGYISCATCHIDGGHDGRVWDFTGRGEGLRRTTDLRGRGGVDHGNVHWSGNFDEIQDFEHDIRGPFGGLGFLPIDDATFASQHATPASSKSGLSPDLDALASYVTSLKADSVPRSPHRNADGTMTAEAMAGAQVFSSMNCASCHSGDAFTGSPNRNINNMVLRNVGTTADFSGDRLGSAPLTGVDTPTLWGLHDSHVYLHHGMATNLEEVFSYAGGRQYHALEAARIGDTSTQQKPSQGEFGGGFRNRGMFDDEAITIRSNTNSALRWTGVDGAGGGLARIAFRYSLNFGDANVTMRVNGVNHTIPILRKPTSEGGVNAWQWAAIELPLNAGTNNTIELRDATRSVAINVLLVANETILEQADAHRQVLDLNETDRSHLLAWLQQLDGRDPGGQVTGVPVITITQPSEGTEYPAAPAAFTVKANVETPAGVTIDTVEFLLDGESRGFDSTASNGIEYSRWFGDVSAGNHTITVRAITTNGGSSEQQTTVRVINNLAPSIALTTPSPGQTIAQGSTVTMRAVALDTDGSITQVRFMRGWSTLGYGTRVGSSNEFLFDWTVTDALGEYDIRVEATDNTGARTRADAHRITIATDAPGDGDGGEFPNYAVGDSTLAYVSADSLVAYLPLDQNALDLQGNLSPTLDNGASIHRNNGQFAGGLKVEGGSERIGIPRHASFNTPNAPLVQRTFSLWFAAEDASASTRQIIFESGGGSRGFNIYLHNGTLYAGGWDNVVDGGANDTAAWSGTWRSASGIQSNVYYHVAIVLDASANPSTPHAGAFKAYLNGVEFDADNNIGMQVFSHSDAAGLGGVNGGSRYHPGASGAVTSLDGFIDEFCVWNRALSEQELHRLANGAAGYIADGGFNAASFQTGGGWFTSSIHLDGGWTVNGSSSKWKLDQTTKLAYVGGSGANNLVQAVTDGRATTGKWRLFIDAEIQGGNYPLDVYVYGVNEPFRIQMYDNKGPRKEDSDWHTPTGVVLKHVTLGGSQYPWTEFEITDVDFGAGYEYIAIMFRATTNNLDAQAGTFIRVDNVQLLK